MTVAFGTAGAEGNGSTSYTLPYPASIAAGDLLTIAIAEKYPATPPVVPSGWSILTNGSRSGGLGPSGVDTGQVLVQWMVKIADGTETGNLILSVPGGNGGRGRMYRWTKSALLSWAMACVSGVDEVPTLPWSVVTDQTLDIQSGDMLLAVTGINGDVASGVGAEVMTATGITLGTAVERGDASNTAGDDMHFVMTHQSVTAGTANVAVAYTATLGTSAATFFPTGATVILRIRETTLAVGAGLAQDGPSDAVGVGTARVATTGEAESTSEATGTLVGWALPTGLAQDSSEALGTLAATSTALGLAESTSEATGTLSGDVNPVGISESTSEAFGIGFAQGTFFPEGLAEDVSEAFGIMFVDAFETEDFGATTGAIASFAGGEGVGTLIVLRASVGAWVDGSYIRNARAPFPVVAFHHPVTGRKLEIPREGQSASEVKAVYTNTRLRTRAQGDPDLVVIQDEEWEVIKVEDWQAFGQRFYRAYVSRIGVP